MIGVLRKLPYILVAIFCVSPFLAGSQDTHLNARSAQGGQQAAQSSPSNGTESQIQSARVLVQQGRYDDAIALLQALAGSRPNSSIVDHELGVAYYRKSDYVRAIEYLKKTLATDPENQEAIQLLGLSYYLSGRSADAIPLLERVQSWMPRANIDGSYILGLCYIRTQNYERARATFAHMFDVLPDSAASYLFMARMLLRQELYAVAEQYAQKAASLDARLPLVHFILGELYLNGRIPDAISEFQKELAINPGHAQTYYKLADAYSRIQKFDEAERLLQRSIWLDATSTGPFILMGKVLEKKGEPELAIRALQRAAAMDPNNSMTHHLLGQAYRDVGKTEDAARELRLAEQLQEAQNANQ